jgi:hypothetical protein
MARSYAMNPFRYVSRMFFTLPLFFATPIIYDHAFAENPTEGMDCSAPKTATEANTCAAPGNLEKAQKNHRKSCKSHPVAALKTIWLPESRLGPHNHSATGQRIP